MKKSILLICILSLACISQTQANWQRIVTNYSRREYNASNQNWMVEQQSNGWMYFANNKGLLEFDGKEWKTYPINNAKLRSICLDSQRIYVGGLSQFGYFVPNYQGSLKYVCLSDKLKKQKIGNIWNIIKIDRTIYFQTDYALFCLENNHLSTIICPRGSACSAYINNKLYITSSTALETLTGNRINIAADFHNIIKSKIVKILPYNDKVLIVSSKNGLFIYDNLGIRPFNHPINKIVANKQLSCGAINSRAMAIGTVQDGVFIYKFNDGSVEHISIENGLQNKTVLSMKFDQDSNLWLGLDNGIDCIQWDSSYYFLYSSKSAVGSGYASCIYNGNLYFGTNQGVYKSDMVFTSNRNMELKLIPETEGQTWSLNVIDHKLFCCGANFFTIIDGEHVKTYPGIRGVWSIHQVNANNAVLGTYFGLYLIQKSGNEWQNPILIRNSEYSAKTFYLDNTANETTIWTANKEHGLYKLILSKDLKNVVKSINYNSSQLPKGNNVYVDRIKGELIICSRQGLFKFNEIKNRLEPANNLEKMLDGKKMYTFIKEDYAHNIWYVTGGMLKLSLFNNQTDSYQKSREEYRLRESLIQDFENVTIIDRNMAVIGTEDGFSLIRYSSNTSTYTCRLQIRKVYLVNKSIVLYGKSYYWYPATLKIKYIDNSVGFRFSLTNYKSLNPSLFSCRLLGLGNSTWSPFTNVGFKEYSNLPEGKYTFQVRSFSDSENKILIDSIDFVILPPWYRTWWAYIFYLAIILSTGFYVFHLFESKMNKQKQEFKKETSLKDEKIGFLEQEKLQAELKYKSDELIRSTLNIVRKNEILEEIKKEAVNMSHAIKDEDPTELKRRAVRLIGQIDNNIEHDDDLKAFQEAFDSVNKDFFKLLSERYPELSKREKLLCVYIKMDLLSKEIAPLMNISVRGVEIGRYRLRKKLGLEERSNLTEFLQILK